MADSEPPKEVPEVTTESTIDDMEDDTEVKTSILPSQERQILTNGTGDYAHETTRGGDGARG